MTRASDFSDPGWVWGRHAVSELLRSNPGRVAQVFLSAGDRGRPEIEDYCLRNQIPLTVVDPQEFTRRFKSPIRQSPVVRLKADYAYTPLDDLPEGPAAADLASQLVWTARPPLLSHNPHGAVGASSFPDRPAYSGSLKALQRIAICR
jgi:hypothetical protein